jgi:hypothetical protein
MEKKLEQFKSELLLKIREDHPSAEIHDLEWYLPCLMHRFIVCIRKDGAEYRNWGLVDVTRPSCVQEAYSTLLVSKWEKYPTDLQV